MDVGAATQAPVDAQADGDEPALIELEAVARRYRVGEVTVTALGPVDLRVRRGEFTVVLGPSGSGQATLLNIIGALDTPSEGRVQIAGQDITAASRRALFRFRREAVAFIFQTLNLFPGLTALENVQFGVDVAGRGGEQVAEEMLARVGLREQFEALPARALGRRAARRRHRARPCDRQPDPPVSSPSAAEANRRCRAARR
jgi:putative ABC transport system ATP-binding protein